MGVKHGFVSSVANIGGATYVQPTHWNAPHQTPPFIAYRFDPWPGAASTILPSAAVPTDLFGTNWLSLRETIDFTNVDYLYITAFIASQMNLSASAALRFQYSPSGQAASWYAFDATGGSGPFLSIASAVGVVGGSWGHVIGATVAVGAAVKALAQPVRTRVAGLGGSATTLLIGEIEVFGF